MDGGDVRVIPVVSRSLDKGVSQLVCPAAWDHVGPILVVSYSVVTSAVSCDIVRLLSGPTYLPGSIGCRDHYWSLSQQQQQQQQQ